MAGSPGDDRLRLGDRSRASRPARASSPEISWCHAVHEAPPRRPSRMAVDDHLSALRIVGAVRWVGRGAMERVAEDGYDGLTMARVEHSGVSLNVTEEPAEHGR